MNSCFDVTVVGGGFAGSLLARVLAGRGCKVLMLDASRHPRFAIGESSTPIADLLLRRLGETEGMADLVELSAYGSWQEKHSGLACGLKRGFSYFDHQAGRSGKEEAYGSRSLVVAASPSDARGDTHWYRPDVDQELFRRAADSGVEVRESLKLVELGRERSGSYRLKSDRGECWDSNSVIDCSGGAAVTSALLAGNDWTHHLKTRTCSAYGHFREVKGFASHFNRIHGDCRACVPFHADDTAQHHLVDGGWAWMLRFNNGLTSLGLTLDLDRNESAIPPGDGQQLLDQLRIAFDLQGILTDAHLVAPETGLVTRGRLQRFLDPVVSDRCVLAPTTALTLDPLHSTGIAHALAGISRLADWVSGGFKREVLSRYRAALMQEAACLDQLVSMAYREMPRFKRFTAACMIYFAAAIKSEERILQNDVPETLWLANDLAFEKVREECERILISDPDDDRSFSHVAELVAPWNQAGLFTPEIANRYAYTATK